MKKSFRYININGTGTYNINAFDKLQNVIIQGSIGNIGPTDILINIDSNEPAPIYGPHDGKYINIFLLNNGITYNSTGRVKITYGATNTLIHTLSQGDLTFGTRIELLFVLGQWEIYIHKPFEAQPAYTAAGTMPVITDRLAFWRTANSQMEYLTYQQFYAGLIGKGLDIDSALPEWKLKAKASKSLIVDTDDIHLVNDVTTPDITSMDSVYSLNHDGTRSFTNAQVKLMPILATKTAARTIEYVTAQTSQLNQVFKTGRPLFYHNASMSINNVYAYRCGVIASASYSVDRYIIVVNGHDFYTGDNTLAYGSYDLVREYDLNINETYNANTTTTLCALLGYNSFLYHFSEQKIIGMSFRHLSDDSTVQPLINLRRTSGGEQITTPTAVSTSYQFADITSAALHSLGRSSDYDIQLDKNGGTGDAKNLQVKVLAISIPFNI